MPEEQDIKTELEDEILVKDVDGKFKILRNGELINLEEKEGGFLVSAKIFTDKDSKQITDFINKRFNLNCEGDLYERLKSGVLTYLNGVRDELGTHEVLIKSKEEGGLGMDRMNAKAVIDFLRDKESIKEKILQSPEVILPVEEPKEPDSILDASDKQEIEEFKEDIKDSTDLFKKDYNFIIERILQKANFSFDANLANRLENILLLRLKNVRENLGTKMVLKRSIEEGGMGFNNEDVEKIMNLLSPELEKKEKFEENKKQEVKKQTKELSKKEKLREKEQKKQEREERDKLYERLTGKSSQEFDLKHSGQKKKKVIVKKLQPPPPMIVPAQSFEVEKKMAASPIKGKASSTYKMAVKQEIQPIISDSLASQKPKIEDIKYVPKIIGPIDELREISIEDFRKSKDPNIAISKIYDMLSLLERQSFTKMIEGIKAFKKSDVFKVYIEIGQEIVLKRATIEEVIALRQKEGKPVLNREEFKVIMEFNKKVKY